MFAVFGLYKITSSSAKKEPSRILLLPFLITFPDNLKKCDNFNLFSSRIFKFLKNQAQAPLLKGLSLIKVETLPRKNSIPDI